MSTPTATPGYRWPAAIPGWQEQELEQLSSDGALGNVPPQVLGAIDQFTSNFGKTGVAVNSAGYGGFFGEGATKTYPAGRASRTLLETPSPSSFATQAEIAASALASYGKTPTSDLNEYATGTPQKGSGETSFVEQTTFPKSATLTGFNPLSGVTWLWTWAHGHFTPKTTKFTPFPGSGILSTLAGGWEHTVAELLVVAAGGLLVIFGLYKAAGSPGKGVAEKAAVAA